MKITTSFKTLALVFTLFTLLTSSTNPQPKTTLDNFLIVVEADREQIKMKCVEGCAWLESSFSYPKSDKGQLIDEFGTAISKTEDIKDENLADFLFSIRREGRELKLEGKKGTAWLELSFSCPIENCSQAINQLGMTSE